MNAGRVLMMRAATFGERPSLDISAVAGMNSTYKDLMQACWSSEPEARPSKPTVVAALRAMLGEAVKGIAASTAERNNKRFVQLLRAGRE